MGYLRTRLCIQEIWSSDNLSTRIGLTSRTVNLLRESYFRPKIRFLAQTVRSYALQILSCHVLGHENPAAHPKSGALNKNEYWNYFWRKLPLDVTPKGLIHQNPSWSVLTCSFFSYERVDQWNVGFFRTLLRIQETWSSDTLSTRIGLMSRTVN